MGGSPFDMIGDGGGSLTFDATHYAWPRTRGEA